MSELTRDDLSEMILRLAHGIRNPLATIKTGVQLVKHLTQPDDEVDVYLASALESVERIDSIIKDLQRYVKLGPTTPDRYDVRSLIDSAVSSVRPNLNERSQELNCHYHEEGYLWVDRTQMVACVQELIHNASTHSPQSAILELTVQRGSEGAFHIHVDDVCGGLEPKMADQVMRPFYSTSPLGTGLGLNIVSKFLDLSGGRLEMEPHHGGGCRFSLIIPEADHDTMLYH